MTGWANKLKRYFSILIVTAFTLGLACPTWAELTVSVDVMKRVDRQSIREGTITFDSSYPTGGEALTASDFNLSTVTSFAIETSDGYIFEYDITNELLIAYLPTGSSSVSNATENAHTHAVALDGGDTGVGTAHSHAVALDGGDTGTGTSHTHTVVTEWGPSDISGVTVGTPALTHNADPATNLLAQPLYCVEGYGTGSRNICQLFSTTNGNTSILGSTDDVSGIPGTSTPRFWVNDSDAPGGVQIYIAVDTNDQFEFVSPTTTDAYILMPFEAIADGVPGYSYAVKVTHAADAATGKAVSFDDNGAADAKLIYIDTGTAGGLIYANDIEVIAPSFMDLATAIITSGGEAAHTHDEGDLVDAASGTENAHTHDEGDLVDAASAGGSAHTHVATATPTASAEVGPATDLQTLTAKYRAIGY